MISPRWTVPPMPCWLMRMVRRLAGPTGHPERYVALTSAAVVAVMTVLGHRIRVMVEVAPLVMVVPQAVTACTRTCEAPSTPALCVQGME